MMSSVVQWFYIKNKKQVAFDKHHNFEIETAFKTKQPSVKIHLRDKTELEVDFKNMEEVDVKTGNKAAVLRRDLLKGLCFELYLFLLETYALLLKFLCFHVENVSVTNYFHSFQVILTAFNGYIL